MSGRGLYGLLREAATVERDALVLGADRTSYPELLARVDRLAGALVAAGIAPGDRVATLQAPHPDAWITFLAAASIGAIWLGLNPRHTRAELRQIIDDAEPSLVFAATGTATDIAAADTLGNFLDRVAPVDSGTLDKRRLAVPPRAGCLLVYTSGTTGRPKGALLHQHGIVDFARTQNRLWPVSAFRIINFLPISHIGSIVDIGAAALAAAGTMIFMEQFDPAASLALMQAEQVTVWGSVPTVFQMQLGHPTFQNSDLGAVELIVWGGAAMPRETAERLGQICPRLATNYGMTETTSAVTSLAPCNDFELLTTSVGPAFPGVDIRIARADGRPAAYGEIGEVLARSENNFLGYWRDEAATAAAFDADGYFRTGDLGRWREDGALQLAGRAKEMFKSGGYNIYPLEIEAALELHPAIDMAVVVPIPDPLWQEVGLAYVLTSTPDIVDELDRWCRERLANYKVPKRFLAVSDLPLLPIGKVDRKALRAQAPAAGGDGPT